MIFRNLWQPKPKPPSQNDCDHDWQKYRETVRTTNMKSPIHSSFFIVKACAKCKTKLYLDYKKEI